MIGSFISTMRFKKGSKVEVMTKDEELTSWSVAEIISGNGHTYDVRYDSYSGTDTVIQEWVSRKVIRPCPPPVQSVESWVAGDVAEIFVDNSWKVATILSVLGGDYYLAQPHGLNQKFRVKKGKIRLRQSWQDGEWIRIGKDYVGVKLRDYHRKLSVQAPQVSANINKQGLDDYLPDWNDSGLQEPHIVSSMMLKRISPYSSSILEAHTGRENKFRAVEKEGRRERVSARVLEKVDDVAYPQDILGEKYMHHSFNSNSYGYYEKERRKSNGVGCSLARISEPNESEIDECSVGSCSVVSRSPNRFYGHLVAAKCQETDTFCSDADYFHGSGEDEQICSHPLEEEVAASIHSLELHAYRSTLEALYASGHLSWEKEALLTNLRISLHISNDEHLIEGHNWRHVSCFQRSKDDARVSGLSLGK